MQRRLVVLCLCLAWVMPAGANDEASRDRDLAAVASALKDGTDPGAILANPRYLSLHHETRFRELIRQHATSRSVLVTPQEPGTPLQVIGIVKDEAGKPTAGALVYVYHTDHRGWYDAEKPHVGGQAGDARHARLFAYLKTDAQGRYEFRTIRPAGYPRSTLPQHIHYEVKASGYQTIVTELLFEGDPRLTPEMRTMAQRSRFIISPVRQGVDRVEQATCDIVLARAKGD